MNSDTDRGQSGTNGTGDDPPSHLPLWKQLLWGSCALGLWLLVFAAGLLIDSEPYRVRLGWRSEDPQAGQIAKLEKRVEIIEERDVPATGTENGHELKPPLSGKATGDQADQAFDSSREPRDYHEEDNPPAAAKTSMWTSYLLATLSFIPVNVAILTILAAFLGGCSGSPQFVKDIESRLRDIESRLGESSPQAEELRSRVNYLNEHPLFSAFRGLIVFLLIASGLFVFAGSDTFTSEPDQTASLTRYIRYAAIFSFFGYFAGHDPTVFSSLLRLAGRRMQPPAPDSPQKPGS